MLDSDKITKRVLYSVQKEDSPDFVEVVDKAFTKSRVYVDDESQVPDQYDAQVSDRGAVYYETDGGSGDFEPAEVEEAIREVDPMDMEMQMREAGMDPDDYSSPEELADVTEGFLQEIIDAQFGDQAEQEFTVGDSNDVLQDVAMDFAEDYMRY